MKKFFLAIMFLAVMFGGWAQSTSTVTNTLKPGSEILVKAGFGFVKGGMPLPLSFSINNTPAGGGVTNGTISFPKNKMGLNAGIDYNYYFNRHIGASATFDFFSNAYKKIDASAPFVSSNINVTQKSQINKFAGAGIIGRKNITNKLSTSLALYGGMLWHKKNIYKADYSTSFGSTTILQFVSAKSICAFAAKGSVRFAYDIKPALAVSVGAEYIVPFFSTKQYATGLLHNTSPGFFINPPSSPKVYITKFDSSYVKTTGFTAKQIEAGPKLRLLAFNVALRFKLNMPKKPRVPKPVVEKNNPCCGTCPVYGMAVTARDKYTKEVLPNTDIAIKNTVGEIVKTGRTNAFGIFVIDKIVKDDYTISGLLNNVALENGSIKGTELVCDKVIQKEILYADRNFIIKGRAFECNTTTPIAAINVTLENKDLAVKKSTMTDEQGNFVLQLPETGTYELYGRKENYFSQIEKVSSSDYNRDKNLFVQLEMCAQKTECGKGINLKNILFQLDKYEITATAKLELNRLVRFMQDNPGVKVELGSHTDCRSSAAYNQTLSQNRANASVDYVVSQGISRDRITGIGYGESKLLNGCADGVNCTEAQHAINRRTEMKVICPDNK
jgi:outer membrane protein OmpA-like peptidoglycan-associated protein